MSSDVSNENLDNKRAETVKPTARATGCKMTAGVTPNDGKGPKSGRAFK